MPDGIGCADAKYFTERSCFKKSKPEFQHDLKSLFSQLGLSNTPEDIEQFISGHSLTEQQSIFEAGFWQPAQKQFLIESHDQDSDWCEAVNEFDVLLRARKKTPFIGRRF
ncbi:DUF2789 domain-containing protein [Endozoicomonas euniceicola]|uniref:DUF2789 domain-containing protein n=1 Tax=Endozoicomonas euniceicola TaxID=1234143 RepID=A0ABY6GZM9_9GAMM|nr:DUF2789 domain-containing protein [Endozoicomonas euniceicola]UYM17443.1 DUF2789 domain-containing protein [Endozoicomonas euniceicola]